MSDIVLNLPTEIQQRGKNSHDISASPSNTPHSSQIRRIPTFLKKIEDGWHSLQEAGEYSCCNVRFTVSPFHRSSEPPAEAEREAEHVCFSELPDSATLILKQYFLAVIFCSSSEYAFLGCLFHLCSAAPHFLLENVVWLECG